MFSKEQLADVKKQEMLSKLSALKIIAREEKPGLLFLLEDNYQFYNFLTKEALADNNNLLEKINNYDNYYADSVPQSFILEQTTNNMQACETLELNKYIRKQGIAHEKTELEKQYIEALNTLRLKPPLYAAKFNKVQQYYKAQVARLERELQDLDNLVSPISSKLYIIFLHELYNQPYLQTIKDALAKIREEDVYYFRYYVFPTMAVKDLIGTFLLPLKKIAIQINKAFEYIITSAAASKCNLKNNFGILNLGKFLIAHLLLIVAATLMLPTIITIMFINSIISKLTIFAASCYKIYSHANKQEDLKSTATKNLISIPKYLLSAAIAGLLLSGTIMLYIPTDIPLAVIFSFFVVQPTVRTICLGAINVYNNYSPLNTLEKTNLYLQTIEVLSKESMENICNDLPKNVNGLAAKLESTQNKLHSALEANRFHEAYLAMRRLHDYLIISIPEATIRDSQVLKALKEAISDFSPLSANKINSQNKFGQVLNNEEIFFVKSLVSILSKATNKPSQAIHERNAAMAVAGAADRRIIFSAPRRVQNDQTLQNLAMQPNGQYNYIAPRARKSLKLLTN